ncbi:uncharacterized protein LOC107363246 [Tetranychus urticae]|uniref:Methyltransferase type 11 domain-containing protein n=1 Tax=Tetranychus urticae TaxID=32264 RepID=T1KCQ3_TETUR|nr:uncharacterized protein LOC107363246 [Tetranychus urticae]
MASEKKDMFNYIEETLKPMPKEECTKMYADWSDKYEEDMPGCGYNAPQGAAAKFNELNLPKDSKILDCGAGTGLLGKALTELGYTNLEALDGCEKMAEKAKEKNIYKKITISYVGPEIELPLEPESYDALIMVGVFCPGHFPLHIGTFKQFLKVLKKGGIITWAMANPDRYAERDETYANNGFQKIMDSLVAEGLVEVVADHPKVQQDYLKGEDGFFWALRKL